MTAQTAAREIVETGLAIVESNHNKEAAIANVCAFVQQAIDEAVKEERERTYIPNKCRVYSVLWECIGLETNFSPGQAWELGYWLGGLSP